MDTDEHRSGQPTASRRYGRLPTCATTAAVWLCPALLDPGIFKNSGGWASGGWQGVRRAGEQAVRRLEPLLFNARAGKNVSGEIKKGRLLAVPRAVPHKSVFGLVTTSGCGGRRRTGAGAAVALPHLFPLGELFRGEDFLELGGDAI